MILSKNARVAGLLVLAVLLVRDGLAQSYIIDTFAGTTFGGDGGPATDAILSWAGGVAVDLAGNVLIADTGNQRIRRVDTSGLITTIAGTGSQGYSGDGGPATEARLSFPLGVAVDIAGNVYFADTNNHRIRKIDILGEITTVAGDGTAGFGGDGGPGPLAQLNSPLGVAVNSAGEVFVGDSDNNRIRKVDVSGNITTFAGNGTLGFSGDGGPATGAQLGDILHVAIDSGGNVYISDSRNFRIRRGRRSVWSYYHNCRHWHPVPQW